LRRVCEFSGLTVEPDVLERAVAACSFGRLREREQRFGFREKPRGGNAFFRRGRSGAGHRELTSEQVESIRRAHGPVMRQLGYA
jgi:hypothetical protein